MPAPGGVPERPKGTGCKPVGSAYGGSNPPAPIEPLEVHRTSSGSPLPISIENLVRKTVAAQQEGKDVVFAGWTTLDELEAAPSAAKLEGVIACLLDCNDGVRRERIQRRAEAGRWTVHTDEEVSAFLQAASEMRPAPRAPP